MKYILAILSCLTLSAQPTARHLSAVTIAAVSRALPASGDCVLVIAPTSVSDQPERMAYATDLAKAFAPWKVFLSPTPLMAVDFKGLVVFEGSGYPTQSKALHAALTKAFVVHEYAESSAGNNYGVLSMYSAPGADPSVTLKCIRVFVGSR